jgi:hypothetical protein
MDRECRNCEFFDRAILEKDGGYCKRRAPQASLDVHYMMLKLLADLHFEKFNGDTALSEGMDVEGHDPERPSWPWVDADQWCGEFEAGRSD